MKKLSLRKPGKKALVGILLLAVLVAGSVMGCSKLKGDKSIEFTAVAEADLPTPLLEEILPEYKQLERALACIVEEKIYVIATRGEKTTSGYTVKIDRITMEEEDGLKKMTVYAVFSDPESGELLTQELTYPYDVVVTELDMLPDEIELKVEYDD